nr:outer membrane beta-barrel protein [uncultured Fluviicola sp.]
MKRLLKTGVILFFFTANLSFAQSSRFEVGVELGPNVSNFRKKSDLYNYKPVVYGAAALSFQYNCSDFFSIRTGLGYEEKGFTSRISDLDYSTSYPYQEVQSKFRTTCEYLTIPVLARFTFGKKLTFFVNTGGYIGMLTNKKDHIDWEDNGNPYLFQLYKKEGTEKYRYFDFGVSAGLGIGIPISENLVLSIEVRDNLGLTNIRRKNAPYTTTGYIPGKAQPVMTNSANLLIGISYRLRASEPFNKSFSHSNRIVIGLEGGPSMSPFMENKTFKNNDDVHSGFILKTGKSYGFSFQWNSSKRLSLRTGITYENKVVAFTTTTPSGHGTGSSHFDYLTIPVLARFSYGEKVHFFFNTGVFFSFLTKQTESTEGTYKNPFDDIYSNYNSLDFGVVGGVGIGVPVQKRWYLSLELRDNFGISNILYPNHYYGRTLRTNSLNLLVGVSYKLGFREAENN